MRALVIGNAEDLDPGLVGTALRRRGWHMCERVRESHDRWPSHGDSPDLEGADLVVSLGSGWSTYWDHVADAVEAEQKLLRAALDRGSMVLGVCFGAQQLATVLGGTVERAPIPEIGWCQVEVATVGADDPDTAEVFGGEWMQWHYDVITVPPGAATVARSPVGVQAFTHGMCLGVQFHPEATESIVREWSTGEGSAELEAVGLTPASLCQETASRMTEMVERTDRLVGWFLGRSGHNGT